MKSIHTNGKLIFFLILNYHDILINKCMTQYVISQSTQFKKLIVALNFGKTWQTINVSAKYGVPDILKVVAASIESQYKEG